MYQSQTTKSHDFQRGYSLSIPAHRLSEVRTVVIACSEMGTLTTSRELEMLEPLAYIFIPGGTIQNWKEEPDEDFVQFLESVLISAGQVEFVVTCLHTRCSHFRDRGFSPHLSIVGAEFDSQVKQPAESEGKELLHFEPIAMMPQHEVVKSQLLAIKRILKQSRFPSARKLKVSGWLYESEIDWISFYDNETDLFLPLSAKVELYCD